MSLGILLAYKPSVAGRVRFKCPACNTDCGEAEPRRVTQCWNARCREDITVPEPLWPAGNPPPTTVEMPDGSTLVVGGPTKTPLLAAVEKARESARVAELDLRAAANAASGQMLAWLPIFDLIEPQTRIAERLAHIAGIVAEDQP